MKLPRHRILIRTIVNRLLITMTNLEVAEKKLHEIGLSKQMKQIQDIRKQIQSIKNEVKNSGNKLASYSQIKETPTDSDTLFT